MTRAPVALFVYKRPVHTRHMIESLLKNPESRESSIYVYCDGQVSDQDKGSVAATRDVVRELLPDAEIIERKHNLGLSRSIISGVTDLCNKYGKVIVIEDDLIMSPLALNYFNSALDYYEEYESVMHISGYMYPVSSNLPSAFFYREATPWGWATWQRSWKYFESNSEKIIDYLQKNNLIKNFNINNSMFFWKMLEAQNNGKIDSWAIRWYGSMFMNNGLALYPGRSLVHNNGFDGSGIHCISTSEYDVELSDVMPQFPDEIIEDQLAVKSMISYRRRKFWKYSFFRLKNYINNIFRIKSKSK